MTTKTCRKCGQQKVASLLEYREDRRCLDKLSPECRCCDQIHENGFRWCAGHQTTHPVSEFAIDKRRKDGLSSYCKEEVKQRREIYRAQPEAKIKAAKSAKERQQRNPQAYMLQHIKSRTKRLGIICTITETDILIPEYCPVFPWIALTINNGKLGASSATVDRIDPELGYIPGNIQVMSHKANAMKQNATTKELKAFADWVYATFDGD